MHIICFSFSLLFTVRFYVFMLLKTISFHLMYFFFQKFLLSKFQNVKEKNLLGIAFSLQQLYKNLSELKPEVEQCIRQGRQIAETKQSADLKEQIDSLKSQYNLLGSKVRLELHLVHGNVFPFVGVCFVCSYRWAYAGEMWCVLLFS